MQGPRAFVATCQVTDDEMRERIEKHRQCRDVVRLEYGRKNLSNWPRC